MNAFRFSPRWLRDPLVVFLACGAVLFGIYSLLNPAEPEADPFTIQVDREKLLTHMQFRAGAFDPDRFEEAFAGLSSGQLEQLVEDYSREEALYREAKSLQLDSSDYVLRLRLIQQLEFLLKGFVDEAPLDEEALEAYWQVHQDAYREPAKVTFTHVFFSRARHGDVEAERLAVRELDILNDNAVPFEGATAHGDRFPYHVNYVEREQELVASHFGEPLTERLFTLEKADEAWRGPYESALGYHLVKVVRRTEPYQPALAEVYDRVRARAEDAHRTELLETLKTAIADQYRVELGALERAAVEEG